MENLRLAEHTRDFYATHSVCTCCAWWFIIVTVEHVRPDDSDEHIVSKKLMLSDPGKSPNGAPMSADATLSTENMRSECLLDRFERERVANQSDDVLLMRIAGWVPNA